MILPEGSKLQSAEEDRAEEKIETTAENSPDVTKQQSGGESDFMAFHQKTIETNAHPAQTVNHREALSEENGVTSNLQPFVSQLAASTRGVLESSFKARFVHLIPPPDVENEACEESEVDFMHDLSVDVVDDIPNDQQQL